MTASNQIIAVLDAICEKFGIVIDWTASNIMPYLQDLCKRIVSYKIATSVTYVKRQYADLFEKRLKRRGFQVEREDYYDFSTTIRFIIAW